MLDYELMLELNLQDFMVYQVYVNHQLTALYIFEDTHRQGELIRDFPEYHGNLYESEKEWDDFRNLIHAKVFFFKRKDFDNEELREELCYIAMRMIENKPDVNPKVTPYYDKMLCESYDKSPLQITKGLGFAEREKLGYINNDFLNYMLSISENYKNCTAEITGAHNLTQQIIISEIGKERL